MGEEARDEYNNRQWMERKDKRWKVVKMKDVKALEMKEKHQRDQNRANKERNYKTHKKLAFHYKLVAKEFLIYLHLAKEKGKYY